MNLVGMNNSKEPVVTLVLFSSLFEHQFPWKGGELKCLEKKIMKFILIN